MKKKEKPNNVKIAEAILEQYKPTTVEEMQDTLKEGVSIKVCKSSKKITIRERT